VNEVFPLLPVTAGRALGCIQFIWQNKRRCWQRYLPHVLANDCKPGLDVGVTQRRQHLLKEPIDWLGRVLANSFQHRAEVHQLCSEPVPFPAWQKERRQPLTQEQKAFQMPALLAWQQIYTQGDRFLKHERQRCGDRVVSAVELCKAPLSQLLPARSQLPHLQQGAAYSVIGAGTDR